MEKLESVWDGRQSLTDSLERDYAAMTGDGWDLIWTPTSPLTTPFDRFDVWAYPDPDVYVETEMTRQGRGRRRQAKRLLKDWSREYIGCISQQGSRR